MATTQIRGGQILDATISRADLNVSGTSGTTVVAKLVQGTGITLSSTGTDSGTGDVTVTANAITGAALTKTDDTNVTLTLGGSPSTALLAASSLTLGWSGTLAIARGGTGAASTSSHFFFGNNTASAGAPAFVQPAFTDLSGSAASAQMPAYTGDVTSSAGATVNTIAANAVTYAKMQSTSSASVLLGCGSAGAGVPQEITLGTNLSMSGTTLNSSGGGGGAPTTATYITQTPDAGLSAEQALSALATGLLKNTTGTGVLTIATAGVDYSAPSATGVGNIAYSILSTDRVVYTNAAFTGARIWTLPMANSVPAGTEISVIDLQGTVTTTNTLTVQRNGGGGDLIYPPGTGSYALSSGYQGATFVSNGATRWYVNSFQPGLGSNVGYFAQTSWQTGVWGISPYRLPTTVGGSGTILVSNGTDVVFSTPTFPNASATSGKIIKSDGTNWVASTETYAAPSTSGNFMQSNGTNWLSATTLGIANGGTGQTTALAARASSGLNVESRTTFSNNNYTAVVTDRYIASTTTAFTSPWTITLPAANGVNAGTILYIGDDGGAINGTNTLSIARKGTDTIHGGTASLVLIIVRATVILESDGTSNWTVISRSPASYVTVVVNPTTTYTPSIGTKMIIAECVGGGGGGGGVTNANPAVGAGGGGGGYSLVQVGASGIKPSYTVAVGLGGAGGLNTGATGSTGGTTTFDSPSIATASGGAGGVGSSATALNYLLGGAGGQGTVGGLNLTGQPGGGAMQFVATGGGSIYIGGAGGIAPGGWSAVGGRSLCNISDAGQVGPTGGNYGCGGGGALSKGTAAAGGPGGNGYIKITEYF